MGSGFRERYLGQGGGVGQSRVIHHSPSLPKVFPHLPTPLAVPHPFAIPYPHALPHPQRHDPCARSGELGLSLRLTSCPLSLGREEAEPERRTTVGDKEMSEMEVRSGEAGDEGVRDKLQGWQPDRNQRRRNQRSGQDKGVARMRWRWWGCPSMRELSTPLLNDS